VFDSNAILLYLGERSGRFVCSSADRPELLSWLFFIGTGLGPFPGQAVHFQHATPEKLPYALNRYRREIERHYRVLNRHLVARLRLFDRRHVSLGLAYARLQSAARRRRSSLLVRLFLERMILPDGSRARRRRPGVDRLEQALEILERGGQCGRRQGRSPRGYVRD
jgi:hypothetical protein